MSTFHQAVGIWLAPDFSAVERGEKPAPYVNHDTIDCAAIAKKLEDFNRCGENVRVRVPNDTIDQVTVHFRMMGKRAGNPDCQDFSEALIAAAGGGKSPVIDVRKHWAGLHVVKERTKAPPPVLLMIVVDGAFEDVILWTQQLSMRFGIKAAEMTKIISGKIEEEDYQGHLPKELGDFLAKTFGVPYQTHSLVARMASSTPPSYA
jgi:hypothetical protein